VDSIERGNLSTVYFAVRAKPDFIHVRADDPGPRDVRQAPELDVATDTTTIVVPRGKRKRDEDYD
jgi:hypothetical protein